MADGIFHPPWRAQRLVKQVLLDIPGIELTQIRHLNYLDGLDISNTQGMVLYYHHKQIGRDALAAFNRFVGNGGGVLAIHSATASFREQPHYLEILGGGFTGHGPVESFDIRPSGNDDEIFAGIGAFTVKDELYLHKVEPNIWVHFSAEYEGRPQPMVWTRKEGNGRVCYVCPGHRAATMKQPQMQEVLRRGLAWIVEGGR